MWEASQWPKAKPWQVELVCVARGARVGVPADVDLGTFELVDEAEGGTFRTFSQVVGDGVVNVSVCLFSRDDCFRLHLLLPARFAFLSAARTLSRRPSK